MMIKLFSQKQWFLFLFLFFILPLHAQENPSGIPPLPEAEQQAFLQIKPDKAPPKIAKNTHYVRSNEYFHSLYQSILQKQPGGVYVGVGTDQNYLMAGWQKPEVLMLMDFDQMVVDVHRVYQVMFLHAKTKEEFLNLWRSKDPVTKQPMAPQIKQWITEEFGEAAPMMIEEFGEKSAQPIDKTIQQNGKQGVEKRADEKQLTANSPKICGVLCKRVFSAYRFSRSLVFRRLEVVHALHTQLGVPTFLTDDGQFQYLVSMFAGHRVFYFRGDLSQHGLGEIAKALQKTHRTLGVLYVSNAELYFPYVSVGGQTSFFSQHMKEMPIDDKSITLHTWATGPRGKLYAYFFHKTKEFVTQLDSPKAKRFTSAPVGQKHVQFAKSYIFRKLAKQKTKPRFIIHYPRILMSLDEPPQVYQETNP